MLRGIKIVVSFIAVTLLVSSCYYITPTEKLNHKLQREAISYLEKARTEMDEYVESTELHQKIKGYLDKGYIPDELYNELKVKKFSTFLLLGEDIIYWSDEEFDQNTLEQIINLETPKGLLQGQGSHVSFRKKEIDSTSTLISLFEIESLITNAFPKITQLSVTKLNPNEVSEIYSYDDLQFTVAKSDVGHSKNIFFFVFGMLAWLGGLIFVSKSIIEFLNRNQYLQGILSWIGGFLVFGMLYYFLIFPLWESLGLNTNLKWTWCLIILFIWNAILGIKSTQNKKLNIQNLTIKRIYAFGSYFLILVSFLFAAFYFKYLVFNTSIPLDFENFFYFNPSSIISLTSIIILSIAFFLIHFRLLSEIPNFSISVKSRLGMFALACLGTTPLVLYSNVEIAVLPFFLVASIYIILFELFIESKQKSITWIVTWLILFSGFSAIILFKYNWQKDLIKRAEIAETLSDLSAYSSAEYPIAIYEDQVLKSTNAQEIYPNKLPNKYANNQNKELIEEGRSSLVIKDGNKYTIVGKKLLGMTKPISLFSYIFGLFLLLAILFSLINTAFPFLPFQLNLKIANTKSLRTKIQLSVISVILASFVIIAIITVFYFKNSAEDNQINQMRSKLNAIVQSINIQAYYKDHLWIYSNNLRLQLVNMSSINEANIQLFDFYGQLVQNMQFDQNATEHITQRLPIKILGELKTGKSLKFDQKIMDSDRQLISYASITNQDQEILGFIAIPDMTLSSYVRKNVNEFIGTLLNVYIFLLLLAGSVAIAVANSITRPLVALGENLKRIKLGQRNAQLDWENQDEVGELINNYNQMINKLEHSAQLLAVTERELAWREMAKQVAHEIKNPLTPMKLSIQHMQHAIRSRPEEVDNIVSRVSNTLVEQIEALSQIASEFSNFANMPKPANDKIILNEIVASAHDLFRKREDMDINLYVPIDEIYVFADKNHLFRVLNNLIKNGIQAIPNTRRGVVNIKLYKEKDHAVIKVSDNGVGIPDDMKEKVFYPNFTTKSSGTGLGLAISANIIETFNGEIYFQTKLNKGTDFYIELPLMHMKDNFVVKKTVAL